MSDMASVCLPLVDPPLRSEQHHEILQAHTTTRVHAYLFSDSAPLRLPSLDFQCGAIEVGTVQFLHHAIFQSSRTTSLLQSSRRVTKTKT